MFFRSRTDSEKSDSPLGLTVKNGEVIGRIVYYIGERPIGNVSLIAAENVRKNRYIDFLKKMWYNYVL